MDLTTPEGVTAYMKQATSDEDWNLRIDAVKRANNGYPSFWWATVVASGLYEHVSGSKPTIGVTDLHDDGTTTERGTWHAITGEKLS